MNCTLPALGSTRLLRLRPRHRWNTRIAAFRLSGREIASPPTLRLDLSADLPTILVRPDGPREPRSPLVIRGEVPTLVLVLLSSALVLRSTNELHSSRREIEWRLPPSILVLGQCPASPPPPNHKPSPGLRAMVQRPTDIPNQLCLHPSRRLRRDLGRRNRFQPFHPSSRRIPTVSCLSPFHDFCSNVII